MRLLHQLLIVRKYERPERLRSGLFLAPAWRVDHSRALWEVVQSSEEANADARLTLMPGWIVVTPRNAGVFLDHETFTREDGRPDIRERFLLHAGSILRIIPWTSKEDILNSVLGARILVKPDNHEEKSGPLYIPEGFKQPPCTGVIMEVGPDVKDLKQGERILYSLYAGTYLEIDGERRLLMEEKQAMMTLDVGVKVEAA